MTDSRDRPSARGAAQEAAPQPGAEAAASATAQPHEPADASPSAASAAEPSLADELARLREELAAAVDRALRAQAELENYRKRVARERQDDLRYAATPLLRDLLPVRDNIQRAIDAADKVDNADSLKQGIRMVAEQLSTVLHQHHCVEIPIRIGDPFDPNIHEAVSVQPHDALPENTVATVVRAGYRLHDRVLRPAQVIVASAPTQRQSPGDGTPPA
jgi:molecular chaperone GrpE